MQNGTRVRDLATGLTGTVIEQDPADGYAEPCALHAR